MLLMITSLHKKNPPVFSTWLKTIIAVYRTYGFRHTSTENEGEDLIILYKDHPVLRIEAAVDNSNSALALPQT